MTIKAEKCWIDFIIFDDKVVEEWRDATGGANVEYWNQTFNNFWKIQSCQKDNLKTRLKLF